MKKLFLVLAIALILISSTEAFANSSKFGFLADSSRNLNSLRFSYSQNHSSVDTGNSKSLKNTSLRLKDPNKAILYAVFPGFFVHGAGHFYGGDSRTGSLLLSTEALDFIFLLGYPGWVVEELFGDMPEFMRSAYFSLGIAPVLFFGSWYYDIFNSPQAVKDYNEKLQMKNRMGLKINPSRINIVFEFN